MVQMAAKRELTYLVFMTASSFGSRTQKLVIDKFFFLFFFFLILFVLKLPPTLNWVLHFDPGSNRILLTLQNIESPNQRKISAAA